MYVLTASQAYQAALESSREQHGLLTWALVQEGLERKKADFAPKNGEITIDEWFRYAAQRVPALRAEDAAGGRGIFSKDAVSSSQVPRFFLRNDLSLEPALIARDPAPKIEETPSAKSQTPVSP
jgi:sulfur relay (sulfurtransferase) complex TusBCD TusD component (DsrE family)